MDYGGAFTDYIDFRTLLGPNPDNRTTIIIRNIPNKMSRKAILNTFLTNDNCVAAVEYLKRNPTATITEKFMEQNCHQALFHDTICGVWNKNYNNSYNIDHIQTVNINDLGGSKLHPYES